MDESKFICMHIYKSILVDRYKDAYIEAILGGMIEAEKQSKELIAVYVLTCDGLEAEMMDRFRKYKNIALGAKLKMNR
jgi:hypothetical protein